MARNQCTSKALTPKQGIPTSIDFQYHNDILLNKLKSRDGIVNFQTGPGWPCTVSVALKNPSQDFKILFALSADEFLAILVSRQN